MQGLNLTGGTSYRLKFYYKGSDGPTWVERLEVKYGLKAYHTDMTNTIFTNNNIITAVASPWDSATVDFTPAVTGVYYVGFHATSLPDQAFLYLDNVSVKITPLVDVGTTAAAGIPSCPAATGQLQATIRNFNLTPQNFATYPVTVTANITGAATGTVSTTINTGTLAPGATQNVTLPAFNFTAGLYNVTISTSQANDPETTNDSYTTSFYVNASPTVANVAPKAICEGAPAVQLTTQFTTPPPAPVTAPAVSSGAISVAVPDNSPVGSTHTLNVSGIPAGATITNISVNVNLTHTWVNDMVLNLKAPNGKIYNLFNRKGGLFQANITNMTISSSATTPIPATGAPFTGTYAADGGGGVGPDNFVQNAGAFSDLFAAANGAWTLGMRDYFVGDLGTLTSWSITITYGFPHPNVTWSPTTGLYTNAAATLGYFGENAYSVYAKPTATTTYTVTSTNPATGCTSSSTVQVTVNPKPVVNASSLPAKICLSDTLVTLAATPAGGVWSGIGVSGSNFLPSMTALGTFNLSYTYTDPLGCVTVASVPARVEDCPERLILLRDNAVILYPNPNDGRFKVRINSILYNRLNMRVYNSSGNLVKTQTFSGLVFNRIINIDLTYLPSGPYMVQFSYDGGIRTSEKTFKVMVAR
jgi:subtilisin-like proprotein convertase family protein